jgi:hypothetical protein
MSYMDRTYEFKGQWGAPSRCGLKIVTGKDRSIVIASELFEDNPGTSVTSFIAPLATLIVKEFGLDPVRTLFIEHCPDRGSKLDHYRESFDLVRLRWDGTEYRDPDWERITKQAVDDMTG